MTRHKPWGAAIAALAIAAAMTPAPVLAHADLQTATPLADSTGPSPTELRLDFSEGLELAFTKVTLAGPDGAVLETGPLALDPADATVLVVPLPAPLPAGSVKVDWKAVADDGHKSEGSYSFTVAP